MPEVNTQVHIQYDSEGRSLPFDALTEQLNFTYRAMEHLAERLLDIQQRHYLPPIMIANTVMNMLGLGVEEA